MAEYEFQFPFQPPMEDLKLTGSTEHGTYYVFDTFCRDLTPEEKTRRDTALVRAYNDMLVRHEMEQLAEQQEEKGA